MPWYLSNKNANPIRQKIKILKKFERESYATGEIMGWDVGDMDHGYFDPETKEIEINWG